MNIYPLDLLCGKNVNICEANKLNPLLMMIGCHSVKTIERFQMNGFGEDYFTTTLLYAHKRWDDFCTQ